MTDLVVVYDANVAMSSYPFPKFLVKSATKPSTWKTMAYAIFRTRCGSIFIEFVYETVKVCATGSLGKRLAYIPQLCLQNNRGAKANRSATAFDAEIFTACL
jgi:hypothetical protein